MGHSEGLKLPGGWRTTIYIIPQSPTLRTVFLLAITRPLRSADLFINRMRAHSNGLSCVFPSGAGKTVPPRETNSIEEFFFQSLPGNATLCPVDTLWVYLDKTRSLQGEETNLFVSFIKPHKAVTSSSIARW